MVFVNLKCNTKVRDSNCHLTFLGRLRHLNYIRNTLQLLHYEDKNTAFTEWLQDTMSKCVEHIAQVMTVLRTE